MATDRAQQFSNLKSRLDAIRQARARDEGALAQNKKRLKDEFDCDTLDAARKKHAALKLQIEKDQAAIDEEVAKLEHDISAMEEAINE